MWASPVPCRVRRSWPRPFRAIRPASRPLNDLLAREGLGVALEVGPLHLDRRGVLGGGVEAELDLARDRPAQQGAPDVLEPGAALLDAERGFELRDLLAHDVDAVEIQRAVDLEVPAVEEPLDVVDLPLHVLQRQVGLDRVVVEDHHGVVPAAPGGLADPARPAEAEVPLDRERLAVVEPARRTAPSPAA